MDQTETETPKIKLQDGVTLARLYKAQAQSKGTVSIEKVRWPKNTKEEKDIVRQLQDDLLVSLKRIRIERKSNRSSAEWHEKKNKFLTIKKQGKWHNIGYTELSKSMLQSYEALNMMETNRLTLYENNTIMSIQQGYERLLNGSNPNRMSQEQYSVYSYLVRIGKPIYYRPEMNMKIKKLDPDVIAGPSCSTDLEKRKRNRIDELNEVDDESSIKKRPLLISLYNSMFLDILLQEKIKPNVTEILERIKIPEFNSLSTMTEESDKCLDFDFYLYKNCRASKLQQKDEIPEYGVIVLGPDSPLPIYSRIHQLNKQNPHNIPIILCLVNESMNWNLFLYRCDMNN